MDYETKVTLTNPIGEEQTTTIGELSASAYWGYIWFTLETYLEKLCSKEVSTIVFNGTTFKLCE